MKSHWLHGKNTSTLLLFFGGWGTDSTPFQHLAAGGLDVLMLHTYNSLTLSPNLLDIAEQYRKVRLVAWSLGVAVAARACALGSFLNGPRLALNGTIEAIDDAKGIPPAIFQGTIDGLATGGHLRFERRMCGDAECYQSYLEVRPERAITDLAAELSFLQGALMSSATETMKFDSAITCRGDRIFGSANQKRSWSEQGVSLTEISGSHFPFFNWQSWAEVFDERRD